MISETVQHLKTEHSIEDYKPYKCRHCDYKTGRITHFIKHVKSHLNVQSVVCDICSKHLKSEISLRYHKLSYHDEDKKKEEIVCDICGFKTKMHSNLRRHITNTHVKPKQCQYCDKRFGVSENLEYHIENHHPGTSDQKYFCSKCGKGFMYQTNLTRHMSEKHGTNGQKNEGKNEEKNEYNCPACKKMYSTKGSECSIQIYLTFSQIPPHAPQSCRHSPQFNSSMY
jgi:KRAB domain-containing zinc finger protein